MAKSGSLRSEHLRLRSQHQTVFLDSKFIGFLGSWQGFSLIPLDPDWGIVVHVKNTARALMQHEFHAPDFFPNMINAGSGCRNISLIPIENVELNADLNEVRHTHSSSRRFQ